LVAHGADLVIESVIGQVDALVAVAELEPATAIVGVLVEAYVARTA
jgi:hypothetical protein